MNRHIQWICAAALLAVLPYLFGVRHGFVYDDHAVIEDNAFLQQPDAWFRALTLQTLFDSHVPDGGRPVVILSYACDRAIWGLRPWGFHLTNMLLHALVVVLVYSLAWRLTSSRFTAFVSALLFGLHPIGLEVVQSPAFREDLFAAAGVLGFLLTFRQVSVAWIVLLITLASKESGLIAMPLLLWLWWCFPEQRVPRKKALLIGGWGALISLLFLGSWIRTGTFQALSPSTAPPLLPIPTNIWTAPWLFIRLLRFLIWPHPLRPEHVIAPVVSAADSRCIVGAAVVMGLAASAFLLRRQRPALGFAFGWILLTYLPVSNLVPLHNPFAERYGYFPCVGFAMTAAWLIEKIPAARLRRFVVALIGAAYSLGIVLPLRAWQNDFTLWERVLAYEPQSARGWTWTGLELKRRGFRTEALARFQHADSLRPADVSALINIAVLRGEDGDMAEAERLLRMAIQRRPDKAEAWWNLAVCLHKQGREREALEAAERARACNPYFAPVQGLVP